MVRDKLEAMPALKGGIVAGIVGGIFIGLYMLIVNLARGQDAWVGFKMAGAPFLGERAMQPGFDGGALVVGMLSHFAVSIAWGALFGLIFYGLAKGATLAVGALWGLVVWIGMFYVVLPVVGLGEMARAMPIGEVVLEHVLFGLVLALAFLPFQRRIARRVAPPQIERPVTPY